MSLSNDPVINIIHCFRVCGQMEKASLSHNHSLPMVHWEEEVALELPKWGGDRRRPWGGLRHRYNHTHTHTHTRILTLIFSQ